MEQILTEIKLSKCKCGSLLGLNSSMNSAVCSFCGSVVSIEEASQPFCVNKDTLIVPFKVTKAQFTHKMLNWLIDGNYTPDDILYNSNFQENMGIYLPFYHFSINYRGFWTADIKHYRTETYTDWEDYYDGNRTRRRPVTKERTVSYWVTTSGQFSGNFTGLGIASEKLPEKIASFCENFDLDQAKIKSFDEIYATGFLMEAYYISWDNILINRIKQRLHEKIDKDVNNMIPVNTIIPALGKSNVRWQIDTTSYNYTVKSIYLPYWLITYYYKEKPYQCIVDGQDINRIEGNKPIDEEKKKKVKSFFYPLIISSASYLVVMFALLIANSNEALSNTVCGYIGLFGFIPIIVFAIIGLIKRHKLLNESKKLRQRILKEVPEITGIEWLGQENNDSNVNEES